MHDTTGFRILRAQEEDRRRLAFELHDAVSDEIALLAIEAETLAIEARPPKGFPDRRHDEASWRLQRLKERALDLGERVRAVSYQLHPSIVDHLGLEAALRSECLHTQKLHGVEVELDIPETDIPLDAENALRLYRCAHEAIKNAVTHSRSDRIRVTLASSVEPRELTLVVKDWGTGFGQAEPAGSKGLGLIEMKERVRASGGTIEIETVRGAGTEVRVRVPVSSRLERRAS